MKTKLSLLLLISITSIYSYSATATTNPNDGSSIKKAITVNSVDKEYELIKNLCSGCKIKSQSVMQNPEQTKYYDVITLVKANGEEVQYFFDISSFYKVGLKKYD